MEALVLDGKSLSIEDVARVAREGQKIKVADSAWKIVRKCRDMVDKKVNAREIMYGVNTGIGEFSEVVLTDEQVGQYQRFLVYSHAAGYGDPLSEDVVRASITTRINVLANGKSGIRPEVIEILIEMMNRGVHPIMCERGSVGASGDLSPMGQMALVPMGEGEAFYKGERMNGKAAMDAAGIPITTYQARDGLATINGSNVLLGMGCLEVVDAIKWMKHSEIAAAMTLEVLNANMRAYDERLHKARGYPGAVTCAANIRRITEGSELLQRAGKRLQDAYSLRSTPQVGGALRDSFKYIREQFDTELNGVGDNPVFFPEDDTVISGANFQGTPLAFPLELLGMGVTTICVLSERRHNRLMNPHLNAGLPAFLTKGAGMMSGLMLSQYTACSLICENRILCHPAATGSIPAAADQEDFVSMGTTTALKTRQILDHACAVLAIELMAGAQAVDLRKPDKPGKGTQAAYDVIRKYVEFLDDDRPLFDDINNLTAVVRSGEILEAVEKAVGPLD